MKFMTLINLNSTLFPEPDKLTQKSIRKPRYCHNEQTNLSQTGERVYGIPYTQNLKRNDTNELKQKQTHRLKRTNLWLHKPGGKDS